MVEAIDLNRHGGSVNHRYQCRAGCGYAALFGCDRRGGALDQRFETRIVAQGIKHRIEFE
jgi:hypothetical protein